MAEAQRADLRQQEKANELLGDIRRRVRLPPWVTPSDALTAVMCILTQHVNGTDAHYVLEALPKSIRPVLERCSKHRELRATRFNRDELLRRIGDHLAVSPGDAEDITSAVMVSIGSRVRREELREIAGHLPLELRDLWAARRVAPPVDPHPILTTIEREAALPDGVTGLGAFTVVMSALTRALSLEAAHRLVESLSLDLRPLVETALGHRREEAERFDRHELLAQISRQLGVDDVEPIAAAVFRAVQEYLRIEVLEQVMGELPRDIHDLWLLP